MFVDNFSNGEPSMVAVEPKSSLQSFDDVSVELKTIAENQRKILESTKAQQEKSMLSKERAAQIKAVLKHKLDNGGHSDEVNADIQKAIDSCDACINAGVHEHHLIAEHLDAAHGNVHKANELHKGTSCNHHHGHHTEKPKFVGYGAELPDEHEHHHH